MSRSIIALSRSLRSININSTPSSTPSCSYSSSSPPAVVDSTSDVPASTSSPSSTEIDTASSESSPSTKYPPYEYPNRLPFQSETVWDPRVFEGKETREIKDTNPPALGSFTKDNSYLNSLPINVRKNLAYKLDRLPPGEELDILTPTMLKFWWKARIAGQLPTNPLTPEQVRESQKEYLKANIEKQYRIRGQKEVTDRETGDKTTKVVGQRIYLPNIVFKLVRNHTAFIRNASGYPIGLEPYNPYEATFRVPKSTTKTDIRSYLKAFYNLDTTFVRTDIRQAPLRRVFGKGWSRKDSVKSHKRAVVGLVEPFHYPNDVEEMEEEEREVKRRRDEFEFAVERRKEFQQRRRLGSGSEKKSRMTRNVNYRMDAILRSIRMRRDVREQALREQAQFQRTTRAAEQQQQTAQAE